MLASRFRLDVLPAVAGLLLLAGTTAAADEPGPSLQDSGVPATPRQVLVQVLEERGGAARFARIVEIRRTGTLTLATRDGERSFPVRLVVNPPDRVLLETEEGEARARRVVGPGEAYSVIGGERRPLEVSEARRLARLGQVDEALLARSGLAGGLSVHGVEEAGPGQLPPELVAGSARGVRLQDTDGHQYVLVVAAGGGLPLRVDYRASDLHGVERDMSDYFRDWRVVDGLFFPFEILMFQGGRAFGRIRFDSIQLDLEPVKAGRPF